MKSIALGKDYLSVSFKGLFADYDRDTLINLYEPIIGYAALALYFSFLTESKLEEVGPIISHEKFLNRIQMNLDTFNSAREQLEAMGLVKTYLEEKEEYNLYHYELYPPYPPDRFINNTLYYGMLKRNLGDQEAELIKSIYVTSEEEIEGEDISATFKEVYRPNYDSKPFSSATNTDKIKGRENAHINSTFSTADFIEACSLQVPVGSLTKDSFSKDELNEISRIAELYGASELEMAVAVNITYKADKPVGERIDTKLIMRQLSYNSQYRVESQILRDNLNPKKLNSESELAKKINQMESEAPVKYLQDLQKGIEPADADLNILNTLSSKYHLTNPVINALVSFTLETQNNTLPSNYMQKVAATLVREGVTNAADALDYLNGERKKRSKTSAKKAGSSETEAKNDKINKEEEEIDNSDEEWNRLIDMVRNGGK
ncbi:MAG: DnaD domain protein [Coprobacillus sp.]|nr:DnaD domain protein [Coprobacillus sp.]